jgi:hypothetical protein
VSEYDEDALRLGDPCANCGLPFRDCDCPDEPDRTCRVCRGYGGGPDPATWCRACNGTGEERSYPDPDEDEC